MNNSNDAAGRLVFMLGTTPNTRLLEEVGQESAEHGDIVQGDLLDTYRNLTYKSVMGHLWVRWVGAAAAEESCSIMSVFSEFCSQADFVIKTDDDIYIDLYATHTVLQKLMKNKKNQKVHI